MMTSLAAKRPTLVVAVIAILVISSAILIQFGGTTSPSARPSTTSSTTTNSSSTTSLAQQKTTSTFSSTQTISTVIAFGQAYDSLFATPGVILNYTITISQFQMTSSHVILSAASTVPGVTLIMNPKEFTFIGTQEAIVFGITVAPTVNTPILPVVITASTATGKTNSSLDFKLNRALVVIYPGGNGRLAPPTLAVNVGQKVTWLNLMEIDDDGNGYTNIALADGSAASPTLYQNDLWSHTFDKPGTYPYHVTVAGFMPASGVIVVS